MASSPRPGVTVEQRTRTTSPVISTPTLTPCIIGPCKQIVEPLNDEGALNSQAQVTTAAVIRSTATVSDPVAASSLNLKLSIGGAPGVTINLPTTVGGASLSHAQIVAQINKSITGASAAFRDNRLEITADTKGSSSRLRLETVADDAYTVLNLTSGVDVVGKDSYNNYDFEVPFSSMPSPLANVDSLVFDTDAMQVYRYFNNVLTAFSKDSAPNRTSRTGGTTEIANVGSIGRQHRPALGHDRTELVGVKVAGSKTDTVVHMGHEASITIPLAHDVTGSGTVAWPDVSGSNYLQVTAIGLQNWRSDQKASKVGNFVGTAGNDIKVTFTLNAALAANTAKAIWTAGTSTLNIQRQSTSTTFAALASALETVENLDTTKDLDITLNYSSDMASKAFLSTSGLTPTFHLSGGEDPIDLSADQAGYAGITGAVQVGGAETAADLGVDGETLSISINGAAPVDVVLSGGIVAQLNAVSGITVTSVSIRSVDETEADTDATPGTAINVLRIVVDTGNTGPDSTLELQCTTEVAEALFGGFSTKTESGLVGFPMGGAGWQDTGRRYVLTAATDFNGRAVTSREKALVPGQVDMTLGNMLFPALILLDITTTDFDSAGNLDLAIKHSALNSGNAFTATINFDDATATLDTMAADILTGIAAVNAAYVDTIGVSKVGSRLAFFDKGAVSGSTLELVTVNTDAALKTAFGGDDFFDTASTSTVSTCRIRDNGNSYALQVVSVGNSLAHAVLPSTLDVSSVSQLTALLLSETAGESVIAYSTGVITITFMGDSTEGTAADKPPVVALIRAGAANQSASTCALSYQRVWACATQATSPAYVGQIFEGGGLRVKAGDMLFNNAQALGRVVQVNDFVIGGSTYTGAKVVIAQHAVDPSQRLVDWYIPGYDLPDTDRSTLTAELTFNTAAERVNVKGALNRDNAGLPISGQAPVYAGYTALRTDVTAADASPSLLVFQDADEVEAVIGPVRPENPLAWGLHMAFLNSSTISISALGVGDTSADAPDGTVEGYADALTFLQKKEVYALAVLSPDPEVHKLVSQHVIDMSAAAQGKERIAFVCPALPTEKVPTLVQSGNMTITDIGGGQYELEYSDQTINLGTALNGKVDALGNTISGAVGTDYTPQQGIYLDRSGDACRWLIVKLVDATTVRIDTNDIYGPGSGPGTGGNDDSYFSTDSSKLSDFQADGESCTVFVRQAAISTATSTGRAEVVAAMAEITGGPAGYINDRLFWMQPERIGVSYGGQEQVIDGHFQCAVEAARVGQFAPQQGHTNMPIVGITRPVGSSDLFSESEMAIAAAGGVWWNVQDEDGAPLVPRHQLSTDKSSIENQELSITKAVDYISKIVRSTLRSQAGRNNITKEFLEQLALGLSAIAQANSGTNRAANNVSIETVGQNPARNDGVIAEIGVIPHFPVNEIAVSIYT
jgi:hypothetical protein